MYFILQELELKRRREIKWRRWQAVDFVQKAKADLSADEISEVCLALLCAASSFTRVLHTEDNTSRALEHAVLY